MNVLVLGSQWGDEGKGKVVDLLAPRFKFVARYQGGHNAGHTVVVGGKKYVFHLLPSSVLHEECECVLGNGMVIDPKAFLKEVDELPSEVKTGKIHISNRAHLIAPWHRLVEEARAQVGTKGIGTTGRGIGPAYEDKAARTGITAGDAANASLLRKLAEKSCDKWRYELNSAASTRFPLMIDEFVEAAYGLAKYVTDTSSILRAAIKDGANVLMEGAQGAMLDIDHGTYPFVTSSSTGAGGACTGLGLPPTAINTILGVAKVYTTRVGNGPFPTEVKDDVAKHIVEVGQEKGATTGRERRPGWFDVVQMRHAIQVNGIQALVLTKADVLSGLNKVGLCVEYKHGDQIITEFPASLETLAECRPKYYMEPGWGDISGVTQYGDLPSQLKKFIAMIEFYLEIPVKAISNGPERHQMIIRPDVRITFSFKCFWKTKLSNKIVSGI